MTSPIDPLLAGFSDDEDAPFGLSNDDAARLRLLPDPGFLLDHAVLTSYHTRAGYLFQLGCALGVVSALAPPELYVTRYNDRQEGNVWPLFVGGSGSYKTTAIGSGRKILQVVCRDRIIPDPESSQGIKQFYQWAVERGQPMPQGVIIYPEMMTLFEQSVPRGPLHSIRGLWTALYDPGGVSKLTRHEDNTFSIDYVRLTILGAVTPSTLETSTTVSDWDNGFAARFLWIAAPPRNEKPDTNRDAEIDTENLRLRALALLNKHVTPAAGLTEEAEAYLQRRADEVGLGLPRLEEGLHGLFKRFEPTAVRIALLHAYSSGRPVDDPGWRLSLRDIDFGVQMTWASLTCATQVFRRLALTPYQRMRRSLLHFLRGAPRTRGEIARHVKGTRRSLQEMIESLQDEGRIRVAGEGGRAMYHFVALAQAKAADGLIAAASEEEARREAASKYGPVTVVSSAPPPATTPAPVVVVDDEETRWADAHRDAHRPREPEDPDWS